MSQYGRQFVFITGVEQNAEINADNSAGYGESVQLGAVNHNKFKFGLLHFAVRHQTENQVFQKFGGQRVIQCFGLGAQLTQPHPTEVVFFLQ